MRCWATRQHIFLASKWGKWTTVFWCLTTCIRTDWRVQTRSYSKLRVDSHCLCRQDLELEQFPKPVGFSLWCYRGHLTTAPFINASGRKLPPVTESLCWNRVPLRVINFHQIPSVDFNHSQFSSLYQLLVLTLTFSLNSPSTSVIFTCLHVPLKDNHFLSVFILPNKCSILMLNRFCFPNLHIHCLHL